MNLLRKPSRRTVLAILLAGSGLLFILGPRISGRLRTATNWLFAPFGDAGMGVTTAFRAHLEGLDVSEMEPAEVRRILNRNESLQAQIHALEADNAELRRRDAFAHVFREDLFGGRDPLPCTLVPARVVGSDSLPYGATRILNAGANEGAARDQRVTTRELLTGRPGVLPRGYEVITGSALVGRISETGPYIARLQLITDPGFRVRANVRRIYNAAAPRRIRIDEGGVPKVIPLTESLAARELIKVKLKGEGFGRMVAVNVKAWHQVRPGDWVQTCRDDARLPAEVRIGKVIKVVPNADNAHFVTLHIAPHAHLDSLREVYIVCPKGALRAKE